MTTYGSRCDFVSDDEWYELDDPPEDFRDLFLGPPGESAEQRAGRLTAAGDVLAELLDEGASDDLTLQDALYAVRLGGGTLLRINRSRTAPLRLGRAA
jgi:hypothetical protein